MISAGDFRNGVTIEIEGNVCQIVEFQHVKPGKGAAFVRTKYKNIITGAVLEKSFRPTEKFPQARIDRKDMQYLYSDGDLFTFMDMDDGSENAPVAMEKVTLGQIIHDRRDRLIYLFDMFGDRAYFLELTGTFEAEKGASYPREIYAQAAAPDQYDPSKTRAEDDDGSIFGEVMSEFSDFEGDDNYDDEY